MLDGMRFTIGMESIYTNPNASHAKWNCTRDQAIGFMASPRNASGGDVLIGEGGKRLAVVSRAIPALVDGGDFTFTQTVCDLDGGVLASQVWKMTDRGVFRS